MMKRRNFLKTVGAGAPATLAATGGSVKAKTPPHRGPAQRKEPRIFLFDDGRHAADLYAFEPPVTPDNHAAIVDQLASSGADTFVYFATVEGGTALYPSQVCQLWGTETKKWTHYVWYRAGKILRQLIDEGHDPLKIMCDRCHETGLFMIASSWVSLQGGTREEDEGLGRVSAFAMDNPPVSCGKGSGPSREGHPQKSLQLPACGGPQERLRLFEELLSKYKTDGVDLNLTWSMPFCRFDQVSELAPVLTQWLRDLRKVADKAEQSQGRHKRIFTLIPAHPKAWDLAGYQVPTWVSEKLVDGLFCESSYDEDEGPDQDVDLSAAVKLTRGTDCRVYSVFHNALGRQFARYATPPMIWAGALNSWNQGVDGFGIGDHLWAPNGWPWTAQEYETLRLLGHPKLLETSDKYYLVRSTRRQNTSLDWLPGRDQSLPKEISVGKPVKVSFPVADRLHQWHKLGRVKSVALRVRFDSLIPDYDQIKVTFNHAALPDSILQKVDMTYRVVGPRPYGYAFDFHLGPEHFPKQGRNTVEVELLKRDPDVAFNLSVIEVDCKIEYRLHRHFEDHPIQY